MTLEELRQRCEKAGFKYAYGVFKQTTEPPHLLAIETASNNFNADNKVYLKKKTIQLDYTYTEKNIEEQNKIEEEILQDVVWSKTNETYLKSEEVFQVSYFFEI